MAKTEKRKSWKLAYDQNHRDSIREYNRKYYAENKLKISERVRKYRLVDKLENPVKYELRLRSVHGEKCRRYCLKSKYGLEPDDYTRILESQCGLCAICGTDSPGHNRISFCVDHCHETGKVRGLLCVRCNAGLGQFKDNTRSLSMAVKYLEGFLEQQAKYQGSD